MLSAEVVEGLGMDGQSSDETDVEDRDQVIVKKREWRDKKINKLLIKIDNCRAVLLATGSHRPGTQPVRRIRGVRTPNSQREAVAKLPINFYDKIWYDSLTPVEQRQLDAGPVLAFDHLLPVNQV
jgi:hypothetical protein